MINLSDPDFRIEDDIRVRLNAAVRSDVLGTAPHFQRGERKRLCERLAIQATMALLEPLRPSFQIGDANDRRRNMPGYDTLVDGKLRIQVKGGTFVEAIGWTHKGSPAALDLDYDLLILVDIGVMLDGRVGRLAKYEIPIKETADFYIFPNVVVCEWVASPRYVNGKGVQLYLYKRPLKPDTKEDLGQCRELVEYRNRFEILATAIASLRGVTVEFRECA